MELLQERLDAILSRVACHGSIRTGRRMQADEMNAFCVKWKLRHIRANAIMVDQLM